MIPGSVAVGEALLILKVVFLVLLYLFIWRIVRTASRDLRLPQESFVLSPGQAQAAGLVGTDRTVKSGRLTFAGDERLLDSRTLYIGRDSNNDIAIEDDFASSRHARIEPRRDGVWVSDAGSTNGTFVNGVKLTKPKRLSRGDVVRVGSTDFTYEK